MFSWRAERAVI